MIITLNTLHYPVKKKNITLNFVINNKYMFFLSFSSYFELVNKII